MTGKHFILGKTVFPKDDLFNEYINHLKEEEIYLIGLLKLPRLCRSCGFPKKLEIHWFNRYKCIFCATLLKNVYRYQRNV